MDPKFQHDMIAFVTVERVTKDGYRLKAAVAQYRTGTVEVISQVEFKTNDLNTLMAFWLDVDAAAARLLEFWIDPMPAEERLRELSGKAEQPKQAPEPRRSRS